MPRHDRAYALTLTSLDAFISEHLNIDPPKADLCQILKYFMIPTSYRVIPDACHRIPDLEELLLILSGIGHLVSGICSLQTMG